MRVLHQEEQSARCGREFSVLDLSTLHELMQGPCLVPFFFLKP